MKKVIRVFDGIAIIIFVLMVLVVVMQVVSRFVLKISMPWTEELSRLLFIYVGFIGTAIATREKELIVVDVLLTRMPKKMRNVFDVFIQLFIFAFYVVLLIGAVKMFMSTKNTYFQSMPFLSNGWTYMAVIIGMAASLVGMLIEALNKIKGVIKHG